MIKRFTAALAAIAILCLPAGAVPGGTVAPYSAPVAKISRSTPTVTDDASKGYAAGAIWTTRRTGAPTDAYVLTDATAGRAVWQKMQSGLLPGDAINNSAGGVVGLYGSALLNSSYTGPLMQVRRLVDGATQDIGAVVNGNGQRVLDTAAALAFAAAAPAQGAVMFSSNASANDTITLNGFTVTFVASGATGQQVNIGANGAATAANLATYLSAQSDTRLTAATYASQTFGSTPAVAITSKIGGAAIVGNYPMSQTGSGGFFRISPTNIIQSTALYQQANKALTVSKIYDQSGAGNHAVSAGVGYEPVIVYQNQQGGFVFAQINGLPAVSFDSQVASSLGAQTTKFLTLPSSLSVPGSTWSFWGAIRPATTRRSNGFAYFGSYGSGVAISSASGVPSINGYTTVTNTNLTMPASPVIFGAYASSQSVHSVYIDNWTSTIGGATAVPTATQTGGYLGIPNSISGSGETNSSGLVSSPSMFDACAMIIVNRPLGSGEMTALKASLAATCNIAPQIRDVYVLGGDSIDQGYGASINRNYSTILQETLNRDYRFYNLSFYGTNTSTQLSELSTSGAPVFAQNSYANYVVYHSMIGTNDLTAGTAAATISSNVASIFSSVKSISPAAITIVETIPAQNGFSGASLTNWPLVNASILALPVSAVVDVAGVTPLGVMSNATATTPYFYDHVHPTTLGHEIRASVAKPIIDGLTPAVAPAQ